MRGFSLIEMMIAMVIGLFVIGSVLGMILAINQSNSETIQSTRLTQELRAITAVISNDLKRARRVDDPIAKVWQGTTACGANAAQPCFGIGPTPTADPSCITYGYSGTSASGSANNYRAIYRKVTGGVGSIVLATGTAAVDCTTAGTALNSSQVDITGLCLAYNTNTSAGTPPVAVGTTCPVCTTSNCTCTGGAVAAPTVGSGEIDVCIAGKFTGGDAYTKTITRSISQPVFIRSIAVQ